MRCAWGIISGGARRAKWGRPRSCRKSISGRAPPRSSANWSRHSERTRSRADAHLPGLHRWITRDAPAAGAEDRDAMSGDDFEIEAKQLGRPDRSEERRVGKEG